jgi:hypothetical protein
VAKAAAPVVGSAVVAVAPAVRTIAEAAAPVVSTVSQTTAAVVEPVVKVPAPVVRIVDQTVAPVTRPAGRTTTEAARGTSPVSQSPTAEAAAPISPLQTSTPVPSADVDELPASAPVVQGAAGGAVPVRPALAGGDALQATPPAPGIPWAITALESSAPATVAAPAATASATQRRATAPGDTRGPLPRDVGLALLGGLLALGFALVSTSSAGGGGHSPSSPVAVTRPFRLVAPALRWRLRALAECVRPEPLLAPLELPG